MEMLIIELARYLESKGLGTFDETGILGNIFLYTLPPSPDECIAIYRKGGNDSDSLLGYDNPSIQFIVRGNKNPVTAEAKANKLYSELHGFSGMLGDVNIIGCFGLQSGPIHLGKDENDRHEFSLNFSLEVQNITVFRE